jgi:hypothetical protein
MAKGKLGGGASVTVTVPAATVIDEKKYGSCLGR